MLDAEHLAIIIDNTKEYLDSFLNAARRPDWGPLEAEEHAIAATRIGSYETLASGRLTRDIAQQALSAVDWCDIAHRYTVKVQEAEHAAGNHGLAQGTDPSESCHWCQQGVS
jgi:hypothetical protein